MFAAIMPYLMTAGNAGVAYQGGKLILQGVEEITDIPVATVAGCFVQTIVDDVKDTFKSVTGPVVAGMENTLSLLTTGDLPREVAAVGASAIEVPTKLIEQKRRESAELSKRRYARAAGYTAGTREHVEMTNQARAGQRLAHLSRVLERRATAAGSGMVAGSATALSTAQRVYKLAALDAAEASINPPGDPRDVLASEEVSGPEKAAITYIIDAVNRDQEPDYEVLADKYVMANSYGTQGREAETYAPPGVAGHGHDHGGEACHCGGTCGKCGSVQGAGAPPSADVVKGAWDDDAAPAAGPVSFDVAGSWDDEEEPQAGEPLPQAHWMDTEPKGCTTGCPVPLAGRR